MAFRYQTVQKGYKEPSGSEPGQIRVRAGSLWGGLALWTPLTEKMASSTENSSAVPHAVTAHVSQFLPIKKRPKFIKADIKKSLQFVYVQVSPVDRRGLKETVGPASFHHSSFFMMMIEDLV